MTPITLNIAQVSNRGYKFAIISGSAILGKFKTVEEAKDGLGASRSYYEYWAESVSASVDNSKKFTIIV